MFRVGIAMLMLIVICNRLHVAGRMPLPTRNGILFWSSIYIPIVVAMAASQNVRGAITGGISFLSRNLSSATAITGGPAAIAAGVVVVIASFGMIPIISRLGASDAISAESFNSAGTGGEGDET